MGTVIACIGCYCCLLAVRPRYIELIALLANVIEIGFLIWGILGIPWGDLNTASKVCYYITCGLVLMTFILLIILMILRCNKSINNSRNSTGKCLSITNTVIDVLAFIMIIVSECLILYKMYDLDYDWDYWDRRRSGHYDRRNGYFSNGEWAAAFFSTSVTEICIIAHFYCVSFLYKLIHLKTDLSYAEYKDKYEPENNVINNTSDGNIPNATTINVYNSPPNYINNNNMTFLGYDKEGRPIYAGNDRYRTINAPIVAQPNINQNNNINNVTNNTDNTNNNQ
jgi:hypothetical protein